MRFLHHGQVTYGLKYSRTARAATSSSPTASGPIMNTSTIPFVRAWAVLHAVPVRCTRIYVEKVSTRKAAAERPGLAAALDYLRPGGTLCVWKLDRLGRSVKEVLTIADDLHARGIGVQILTGKLSGSYSPTGEGKFFFTMMAALAELERDIIHERTMAGLAAARAQGRAGGRPTLMGADKLAAAEARRARGESPTEIARALGVSRASVYRHLSAVAEKA